MRRNIRLFIPALFSSVLTSSDILSTRRFDLDQVFNFFQCKESCSFNETRLNSVTIKLFPKCKEVCGIIYIDSETDLTVEQMKKAFEKMRTLKGGFSIVNTDLTSLSVFTANKEKGNFNVACDVYGVHIRNNSQLNDSSMLYDLYLYRDLGDQECEVRIENNPKLEVSCDGGFLHMYNELLVKGNLKDCGCIGGKINISDVQQYSKCKTLDSGLELSNINETFDLAPFSKITLIRGNIDVRGTNLRNLSFLKKLQIIRYSKDMINRSIVLNLQDNPEMIRLGLPKLTGVVDMTDPYYTWDDEIKYFNFENLNPDFCLTLSEMRYFLFYGISTINIQAKLCTNPGKLDDYQNCIFESMSKLPEICLVIIGDLVINGEGDEKYLSKLKYTEYLFGTVTVKNTNLTSLASLDKIKFIGALNGDVTDFPVIQIYSNPNLRKVGLNGVENVITNGNRTAIIQDNHPDLFKSTNCQLFGAHYSTPNLMIRVNLTYIGSNCGERVNITSFESGQISIALLLLLLLCISILFQLY